MGGEARQSGRRKVWWRILVAVLVLAGAVAFGAWYNLFREEPQQFDSFA